MRVRFAPGDVLPLNWVKGSGGAGTKDLVTMELQSGSIELLAPGYSFADIQSVGPLGTPWSHEAHALFRVARLSDKPDQARSLRYAPPGTFTFDTKDNVEAISGAYCNTGWFLMDEHKNKLKWAWASSIDCRLRAGRDGATVTLKLDRVRDIQAVSGAMNLSSSKACKLNDLSESIYNEALNEVVRLLLPHPAQISLQSSRSSKTLHDEIVRSIRRHTSVLTVDPVHMTQFDSHARDQFINVLGPESPLLVLIEGEMILRCKPGAHSASMEGDPPKQEVVSRLVVGSPAKDANLDSSDLKDKVPTYSIRSGVCVLDAESLLSPTIPQALLMNINANSKFYWVPERTCKFLVLDR